MWSRVEHARVEVFHEIAYILRQILDVRYLAELQFHRGRPVEHLDLHPQESAFQIDLLHHALEPGERTVVNLHLVADIELRTRNLDHLLLGRAGNGDPFRNFFRRHHAADPGNTFDPVDEVPDFFIQHSPVFPLIEIHPDEDIPGKEFALLRDRFAVAFLRIFFDRELDFKNRDLGIRQVDLALDRLADSLLILRKRIDNKPLTFVVMIHD